MDEYKSKLQSEAMDFLCEAILSLKSKEECYRFFDDICTINEIKALEQRLQVAKMLRDKKTYLEIAAATGASTATISRVNRCLNYGSDGYTIVLERIDSKE
ncbi:YerC/YecD family TrpR-related protein [Clostridium sp. CX1]|uniref:YerC/YecD family TrpR-related protein n=1 Tax=Clostridium tanneri TaxID=3037988 RepID=A0ABU4JX70_9CLOT|nr:MULTISPECIES: YerC/YecD family TrpR-related protein [unclassified Clostridium]MCT8976301.1 YerC/YecD family TrpR-related protein [Clostridium sp. CX1]MDW8802753.1 YerC/YecD family TrpR-related protein [Clostridium sp. A1-XYC3]